MNLSEFFNYVRIKMNYKSIVHSKLMSFWNMEIVLSTVNTSKLGKRFLQTFLVYRIKSPEFVLITLKMLTSSPVTQSI